MDKKGYTINLKNPEDSPEKLASKLNTLVHAIDPKVMTEEVITREVFDKKINDITEFIKGNEDRVNYTINTATKKLTDQRYHGGGISAVSHNASLAGLGTPDSPLSVVSSGTGDVVGPSSATADHVVFFNGTTGKLIKDSGLTLSGTNTGDQNLSTYVVGAASATDNAIARFDLTTGKIIQNSVATIDDSGNTLFGTAVGSATATPLLFSLGGTYGTGSIGASANIKLALYDDGTVNKYGIGMSANFISIQSANSIAFTVNNGTEVMRMLSTGKIGIFNTNPLEMLSLGTAGTTTGLMSFSGGTSGKVILTAPLVAGAGTLTLPAATDTLVGQATSDVLTNKDLTSGTNTFPTFNQNTTGSAAKLTTARTIAGVSFDGTANIAIASTNLSDTTSIVLLTASQTLTNKVLTSPSIATPTITSQWGFGAHTAYFTETDNGNSSTADTIDWGVSNKQKSTRTGSCTYTFTAPTGPASLILKLVHEASATVYTVTWPAAVKWASGAAPILTNTSGAVDIISFYYDGTNYYGTYGTAFA